MWTTHRAEVNGFRRFARKGFVVIFTGSFWVKTQVKLVFPTELKTGFRQHIVPFLRARMSLREISCVCSDFIGDDTFLHIVSVRQTEVFLRSDIAEHRTSKPSNHRRTYTTRDVVVAGSDVSRQWTQCVKRCFVAMFQLQIHILLNHLHRDMSRSLNHDLAIVFPSDLRKFTERLQLRKLCLIVRISDRTRTQSITERERDIVGTHNFTDFREMRVEETLLMM